MCPLSLALFERFTVCSAKMAEPIDGKASNRLRYTLSVVLHCGRVVVCIVCGLFNNWSRVAGVLPSAGGGSPGVF